MKLLLQLILIFLFFWPALLRAEVTCNQTAPSNHFTSVEKAWIKSNPFLRVSFPDFYPPYSVYTNEISHGFIVDYIDLIALKSGLRVTNIAANFSQQLQMMKDKKIDVLPLTLFIPEQTNFLTYYNSCYHDDSISLVHHNNTDLAPDYSNIEELKLGVVLNSSIHSAITDKYPQANLVLFDNYAAMVTGLSIAKCDLIFIESLTFDCLSKDNNLKDYTVIPWKKNDFQDTYRCAIGADRTMLKSIVAKTKTLITKDEIEPLKNKWLDRCESKAEINKELLDSQEIDWINENQFITIAITTNYTSYNDSFLLKVNNLMESFQKQYGRKYKIIKRASNEECLQLVKEHKASCTLACQLSSDSSIYLTQPCILQYVPMAIVSKKEIEKDCYKHLLTAVVSNRCFNAKKTFTKALNLNHFNTLDECFQALKDDKTDMILDSKELLEKHLKANTNKYHFKYCTTFECKHYLSFAVNKDDTGLIKLLANLSSLESDQVKSSPLDYNQKGSSSYQTFLKALLIFSIVLLFTSILAKLLTSFIESHSKSRNYKYILFSCLFLFVVFVIILTAFTFNQHKKYNDKTVVIAMQKQLKSKHDLIADVIKGNLFIADDIADNLTAKCKESQYTDIKDLEEHYINNRIHSSINNLNIKYILLDRDLNLVRATYPKYFQNSDRDRLRLNFTPLNLQNNSIIISSELVTRDNVIAFAKPIYNDKHDIIAFLILCFDKANIDLICKDLPYQSKSNFLIYNENGDLISKNPFPAALTNTRSVWNPISTSAEAEEANNSINGYKNLINKDVIGSWLWNENLNLGFAIEYDYEWYENNFDNITNILKICLATIIISSLFICGLIIAYNKFVASSLVKERISWENLAEERLDDLNRNASRFKNFFNNIPGLAFSCDLNGKVILFNSNFKEWLNVSADSIEGQNITEHLPANIYIEIYQHITSVFENQETMTNEFTYTSSSGKITYYNSHVFPIFDKKQHVDSVAVIIEDQTEFKLTEEQLLHEQIIFKLIADNAKAMIYLKDKNGVLKMANQSYIDIVAKGKDVVGKKVSDFLSFDYAKISTDSDQKVLQTEEFLKYEIEFEDYFFLAQKFPYYGLNNELLGVCCICIDVTDLTKLQQQLKEKHELLQIETVNAKAATETKGRFLANMSHEIRTPLNAIYGNIYRLGQQSLGKKNDDFVQNLILATDQLIHIVDDILDFSKIEAGKIALDTTAFSMKELIKNSVAAFKANADDIDIKLSIYTDDDSSDFMIGDTVRIKQIIYNLISNAIKFSVKEPVNVVVYPFRQDKETIQTMIAVIDTGIGMTAEQIGIATAPFSQGDNTTTRKYGGSGLGLSISNNLLEMMESCLNIESNVNEGTCCSFFLKLPRANAADISSDIYNDPEKLAIPDLSDKLVLVVEDNIINQNIICDYLSDTNCKIKIASSGVEAVDLTGKFDFDLILMDVHMAEMDGLEATRIIRKNETKHNLIIALTAAVMQEDVSKAFAAGIDEQINKPIMPHVFYKKISKALEINNVIQPVVEDLAKENINMIEIDGMDYQANLKRMMDNEELIHSMLIKFAKRHADDANIIKTKIKEEKFSEAIKAAHNTKGTAGMLDALDLYKSSLKLETALKKEPLNVEPELTEFDFQLNRFVTAIKRHFDL